VLLHVDSVSTVQRGCCIWLDGGSRTQETTYQPGSISTESAELHLRSKGPAVAAMDTQQGLQDSRPSATVLLLPCQHRWTAKCNFYGTLLT
jgi:hypothetical protein